jgi:hypothetical protein
VRLGGEGPRARQGGATASDGRPGQRVKKQGRELGHWKEEERGKEALTRGATLPERERRESGRSGGGKAPTSGPEVAARERGERARVSGLRKEVGRAWLGRVERRGERGEGCWALSFSSSFLFLFHTQTIQTILFEFK